MAPILNYSSYQVMLDKLKSSDADFRCMAMIDFQKEAKQPNYRIEHDVERLIFKEVLKLALDDSNSEVKNMSVQCLATLTRLSELDASILSAVDSLLKNTNSENEEQRDIATLALKNVLMELDENSSVAVEVIDKVIQGLSKSLLEMKVSTQHVVELLDIVNLIFNRFGPQVASQASLQNSTLSMLLTLLSSPRPHIRKRAIVALGSLVPIANREVFDVLSERLVGVLGEGSGEGMQTDEDAGIEDIAKRTAYALLIGTLARTSANRIGKVLPQVVPGILSLSEQDQDDDALEASMTTLETLVVKCPTEVTPFLTQITSRACVLLQHDPNYVPDDDDMMNGEEEEDSDDDFEEEYSDDEDVSWKARRSAAKLLQSLIGTRIELLNDWYATVAPLLTARLKEREESVRIEVFAAWETLLRQTGLYGGSRHVSAGEAPTGLKRKRLESISERQMSPSSNPLSGQTPALARAALQQTVSKSLPAKEKSFHLLRSLVRLSPGCLEAQSETVIVNVQKAFGGISATGESSTTSLVIAVLSFLGAFIETHQSRVYASALPSVVDSIVAYMGDRYQRVSLEALKTAASLAKALRPIPTEQNAAPLVSTYIEPVQKLYGVVCDIIGSNASDSEVKNRALEAVGDLLTHEGEALASQYDKALPLIASRLNSEPNQVTALNVIGDVAESPACEGPAVDQWLKGILEQIPTILRRCHKQNREKTLEVLKALVSRFGPDFPLPSAKAIVTELKSYVNVSDLHNLGETMRVLSQMLRNQSALRDSIANDILPAVKAAILSPLLHAAAIEGMQELFAVYAALPETDSTALVQELVDSVLVQHPRSIPTAEDGGTQAFANVAKCIATVLETDADHTQDSLKAFMKIIGRGEDESPSNLYLGLLVVGEVGRVKTVSDDAASLKAVLALFKASSEQIKSAAAFAAGNIAVGNTTSFLPVIVKGVADSTTPADRLLYLHALKEAILHCSNDKIEGIADSLWDPLLVEDEEGQDDGARNVKAACVGKLTSSDPVKYISNLRERLPTATPVVKATIAASMRYTLTDSSAACDEVLAGAIYDFLALMQDPDHIVRRLAVSSLNAAAQNKTELIEHQLPILMQMLYAETRPKKELVREYQMGPFVVRQDDGLNNRKGAFEALQTLLDTSFTKLNLNELLDTIVVGLSDVDEVKLLSLMLLSRLSTLAEGVVSARLDELVDAIESITKPIVPAKDDTEQDMKRKDDFQKTAVSCIAPLSEISSPVTSPKFDKMISELARDDKWQSEFQTIRR